MTSYKENVAQTGFPGNGKSTQITGEKPEATGVRSQYTQTRMEKTGVHIPESQTRIPRLSSSEISQPVGNVVGPDGSLCGLTLDDLLAGADPFAKPRPVTLDDLLFGDMQLDGGCMTDSGVGSVSVGAGA